MDVRVEALSSVRVFSFFSNHVMLNNDTGYKDTKQR